MIAQLIIEMPGEWFYLLSFLHHFNRYIPK
ncbi:MAG: hypothetical protein KatS3mg032_1480 [Cyclobacteriaceae bacterium]|nr:MAG: hypothetical protein KatS3mg032_1480 [Cyclobacteriaceae bacterium]